MIHPRSLSSTQRCETRTPVELIFAPAENFSPGVIGATWRWQRSGRSMSPHISIPDDVRQKLAALGMLFDWLIIGRVMPSNTAPAIRGPHHVVKSGRMAILDGKEWRELFDAVPTDTVRHLRDRMLSPPLSPIPSRGSGRH